MFTNIELKIEFLIQILWLMAFGFLDVCLHFWNYSLLYIFINFNKSFI